ncbi:hypothetical protein HYFRA_00008311 [Hymenoscyphus fraxineus]|uniref:Uncharacterized protein n=1 Tax=Hymenoscyphus fraxineus TaxID=746836 RepID=A0A9N9PNW8_9HELO|nr:hypothetical protein HYFRA_00008311 [Hymenoscyphus fraxineus]
MSDSGKITSRPEAPQSEPHKYFLHDLGPDASGGMRITAGLYMVCCVCRKMTPAEKCKFGHTAQWKFCYLCIDEDIDQGLPEEQRRKGKLSHMKCANCHHEFCTIPPAKAPKGLRKLWNRLSNHTQHWDRIMPSMQAASFVLLYNPLRVAKTRPND